MNMLAGCPEGGLTVADIGFTSSCGMFIKARRATPSAAASFCRMVGRYVDSLFRIGHGGSGYYGDFFEAVYTRTVGEPGPGRASNSGVWSSGMR